MKRRKVRERVLNPRAIETEVRCGCVLSLFNPKSKAYVYRRLNKFFFSERIQKSPIMEEHECASE